MKKKKLTAVLGLCALSISMLAGCGGKKDEATATTEEGVEEDLGESGEVTVSLDDEDAGNEEFDEETLDEAEEEDDGEPDPDLFSDSAVIDDENDISFLFEANKEHIGALPDKAEMTEKDGDLDAARWESLKIFYEGDEADAQEEMDELRQADPVPSDILKLIEPYYPEIARRFQQAGIKHYDMTKPYYIDSEEVDYDLYNDQYGTFYLTVYLSENGKIESFEMVEEGLSSGDDEITLDEGDLEDGEDGEVIELEDDEQIEDIDEDAGYLDIEEDKKQ